MIKYRIPKGTMIYRRKTTASDQYKGETWDSYLTTKEVIYDKSDFASDSEKLHWTDCEIRWYQFRLPKSAKPWKLITVEREKVETFRA